MKNKIMIVSTSLLVTLVACSHGKKFSNWDKKPLQALYTGGSKFYIELKLYADSTFRYELREHIFGIRHRKTGAWLGTDSSIILYAWEKKHFSKKTRMNEYRLRGDSLLMFSKESESGPNADYLKTYYTLYRQKR